MNASIAIYGSKNEYAIENPEKAANILVEANPELDMDLVQKDLLLPYKTVLDNISLPLLIKKENKQGARQRAKGYFTMFGQRP